MFKIRKRKLTKESFHDELTNAFNEEPVDPYEYAYRVHYVDLNTLAEMYGLKGIHGISIVIQNIISAFVTGNQQVIEDYRKAVLADRKTAISALRDFNAPRTYNEDLD